MHNSPKPRPQARWTAAVLAIISLLLAWSCPAQAQSPLGIKRVAVEPDHVTVTFNRPAASARLYALAPYQSLADTPPVYTGPIEGGKLRLKRGLGGGDLMLRRFVLGDGRGNATGPGQWATDLDALPRTVKPVAWPDEIKGVSNPEDLEDLVALGVRHVHVNMSLIDLLLPPDAPASPSDIVWRVDGRTLRLDPAAVAKWDQTIRELTERGINVVIVVLNPVSTPRARRDPRLVCPDTDIDAAPHGLGAFNLSSADGVDALVGTLSFIADRYSRADGRFGRVGGYIIGNEVDSHWSWHNMGGADLETVAEHYSRELRLAWLAVREQDPEARVFASLTHSWSRPNSQAKLKNCAGKDLFDRLVQLGRAGGDFGWDLAYHPYPQNLFEPRFWNDTMAMFGYDTPMITFKNIEVLAAYLKQPGATYHGKPRRLILSEQGLHTPAGERGQTVQAAALALAYHRLVGVPGVDAFILHRHVDSPNEGGLELGLRRTPTAGGAMGAKKRSWDVFRELGRPGWRGQMGFALGVAGYDTWAQASPRPGPFPDHAPGWSRFKGRANTVISLVDKAEDAAVTDALLFARRSIQLPDGGLAESLLLHPRSPADPPARAVFTLDLPKAPSLALVFQTHLAKAKSTGVVYRVRVNGDEVFQRAVAGQAIRAGRVDLSDYAGQQVELTLQVDPGENNHYDEAHWINPAIVREAR